MAQEVLTRFGLRAGSWMALVRSLLAAIPGARRHGLDFVPQALPAARLVDALALWPLKGKKNHALIGLAGNRVDSLAADASQSHPCNDFPENSQ